MSEMIVIARKEIKDSLNNKFFLSILILLLILTIVSIVLGTLQVHSQIAQYNRSIEFLKSMGKTNLPPMPSLNPLSVSKGFVNYVGMIGALLAIVLGNYAVSKERKNGTFRLILSRPIYRDQLINGKLGGNLLLLALINFAIAAVTLISLSTLGGVSLSGVDITRLTFFFTASFLYMALFFILSLFVTLLLPYKNYALLTVIIIWLVFAFIFPQIGDTMDMDNQLPGGFFASMGMNRAQEQQIVNKFKVYETLRNGIEELSPTKHFERISFALLGVKPGFENNTAWEIVKLKWLNLAGLLVPNILLSMLSYLVFLRRENIYST